MPPITAIEQISNGYRITCLDTTIGNQGVVTATRNDLPGNLRTSTDLAAIEAFINNFLKTALTFVDGNGETHWKFYAEVHVFSNTGSLNMTGIAVDFSGFATEKPTLGAWW